jgi:hypothetical protein
MRLSCVIVFFIGAMVAPEGMCHLDTTAAAESVRNWFEKTVHRLERGQTLKQNQKFIALAINNANQLLRMHHVGRYANEKAIKYPGYDQTVINTISKIKDSVLKTSDSPTVQVKYVLDAIKHVLLGNHEAARAAIEGSKQALTSSVSFSDEPGAPQNSEIPFIPPLDFTFDGTINPYFIDGRLGQTAAIRVWLGSRLSDLSGPEVSADYVFNLSESIVEIAQALVNSLGNQYLPNWESKFIGRYSLVGAGVVAGRIENIAQKITCMNEMGSISEAVVVMKSVLQAITDILNRDFRGAETVIALSKARNPCIVTASDMVFYSFMFLTYGL